MADIPFDPNLPTADPLPGEKASLGVSKQTAQQQEEEEQLRITVGAVYTFVRSQELNRTVANFTLDHFIDEAIRQLRGDGTAVRDAAGNVVATKTAQLERMQKLQNDFNSVFSQLQKKAQQADQQDQQTTGGQASSSTP